MRRASGREVLAVSEGALRSSVSVSHHHQSKGRRDFHLMVLPMSRPGACLQRMRPACALKVRVLFSAVSVFPSGGVFPGLPQFWCKKVNIFGFKRKNVQRLTIKRVWSQFPKGCAHFGRPQGKAARALNSLMMTVSLRFNRKACAANKET